MPEPLLVRTVRPAASNSQEPPEESVTSKAGAEALSGSRGRRSSHQLAPTDRSQPSPRRGKTTRRPSSVRQRPSPSGPQLRRESAGLDQPGPRAPVERSVAL